MMLLTSSLNTALARMRGSRIVLHDYAVGSGTAVSSWTSSVAWLTTPLRAWRTLRARWRYEEREA